MLLDVELLKEVDEALACGSPPDVLWHYTSVHAANEILKSRALHLGCHAFMSDPAEGVVAGRLVTKCWKGAIDATPSHPRLDLSYISDTSGVLSYFDFDRPELPPTFLLSLTELRDSLSQWSRYADDGGGIALGFEFDPAELPTASEKPWTTGTKLVQVDYDHEDATSKVRPLVGRLLRNYLPRFRDPTEVENTLIALVHRLNPVVKAGTYAEEREWRLTSRTVVESEQLYDIKASKFGLVPYASLPFDRGVRLVELMLGPKLSPENAWSAKWLCKKFGHAARISTSALAYR
jgi:hypothetical protein